MIRVYEDLTDKEVNELSHAWLNVYKGLEVYEKVTGADLSDVIGSEIWEHVEFQKEDESDD